MDKKLIFNENVENYEKYRPSYVPQLYYDIAKYSDMDDKSRVLEIGAGTGQATEWFVSQNVHLTAIDIGENMTQYLQKSFIILRMLLLKTVHLKTMKQKTTR